VTRKTGTTAPNRRFAVTPCVRGHGSRAYLSFCFYLIVLSTLSFDSSEFLRGILDVLSKSAAWALGICGRSGASGFGAFPRRERWEREGFTVVGLRRDGKLTIAGWGGEKGWTGGRR